jgi:hypothetical protein
VQADAEVLDRAVRLHIFGQAAETGRVPTPLETAEALGQPQSAVEAALGRLAAARVLILAPGTANVWAANPFCAVPSAFRVEARGRTYWGICIWDALGIPAALHADGTVTTQCGDCGEELVLEVRDGALARSVGVVHFGVPAARWWENIAFT